MDYRDKSIHKLLISMTDSYMKASTPTLKVTNMKKILCALLLQVQKSKAFAHRCERRSQIQFDSVTSSNNYLIIYG